jgi:hypothetical protein
MLFGSFGFIEGIGRVMDIGSTMTIYNDSLSPEEADACALGSDWQTVGQDLKTAINDYAKKHKEP